MALLFCILIIVYYISRKAVCNTFTEDSVCFPSHDVSVCLSRLIWELCAASDWCDEELMSLTSRVALLRRRQGVCGGGCCGGGSPQVRFQREQWGSLAVRLAGLLDICVYTRLSRVNVSSCAEPPGTDLSLTLDSFCPRDEILSNI